MIKDKIGWIELYKVSIPRENGQTPPQKKVTAKMSNT